MRSKRVKEAHAASEWAGKEAKRGMVVGIGMVVEVRCTECSTRKEGQEGLPGCVVYLGCGCAE